MSDADTDGDGIIDLYDSDDDNDGINDADEALIGTDPLLKDTDGDGVEDGALDFDNDGISNADESDDSLISPTDQNNDGNADIITNDGTDSDNDGIVDLLDLDSDGDGLADSDEGNADLDNDGIVNSLDRDSDNDGLLDIVEFGFTQFDTNNDGIINTLDTGYTDSNNDGVHDLVALLIALDSDSDAIADAYEIDSDNDSCLDVIEAGFTDAYFDGQVDGTGFTNDGLISGSDGYQSAADSDNNTVADYRQASISSACPIDSDNDGIANSLDMTVIMMVFQISMKAAICHLL